MTRFFDWLIPVGGALLVWGVYEIHPATAKVVAGVYCVAVWLVVGKALSKMNRDDSN